MSVAISQPRVVDPRTADLQGQRERLVLENQVREETLRVELGQANAELQRLKSASDLARARSERTLVEKRLELEGMRIEIESLAGKVSLQTARNQAETQAELAAMRKAKERAELEAELANAAFLKKSSDFKVQELAWNAKNVELRARMLQRERETEADSYAEQRPVYLKDPLQSDGSLVLSDRRIALNGPITMTTADEISARIDYFNNKTHEFPIFIVIDDSPGGSVMAGYKILRSMQSSAAPVYVVVKSFAASMAAAITTMAKRSFAYPNAIILHHQISNGMAGNLTVQREGIKNLEEWWHRLAAPIAAKMGVSVEEFIRQMYAHTATGDWKEFADNAVKLKWVDVVVGSCRETAWVKDPQSDRNTAVATTVRASAPSERVDAKGITYVGLPRLNPMDCYYLYNPDGYFRPE